MKRNTLAVFFLIMCVLSVFAFGDNKQFSKRKKIYISAKEIICSEKGIFINYSDKVLPVKSIAIDENGIYILKRWFFGNDEKERGDKPRGGHSSNRQESNRDRHERADGRRQREQAAAQRRQEEARRRGRRGKWICVERVENCLQK